MFPRTHPRTPTRCRSTADSEHEPARKSPAPSFQRAGMGAAADATLASDGARRSLAAPRHAASGCAAKGGCTTRHGPKRNRSNCRRSPIPARTNALTTVVSTEAECRIVQPARCVPETLLCAPTDGVFAFGPVTCPARKIAGQGCPLFEAPIRLPFHGSVAAGLLQGTGRQRKQPPL